MAVRVALAAPVASVVTVVRAAPVMTGRAILHLGLVTAVMVDAVAMAVVVVTVLADEVVGLLGSYAFRRYLS